MNNTFKRICLFTGSISLLFGLTTAINCPNTTQGITARASILHSELIRHSSDYYKMHPLTFHKINNVENYINRTFESDAVNDFYSGYDNSFYGPFQSDDNEAVKFSPDYSDINNSDYELGWLAGIYKSYYKMPHVNKRIALKDTIMYRDAFDQLRNYYKHDASNKKIMQHHNEFTHLDHFYSQVMSDKGLAQSDHWSRSKYTNYDKKYYRDLFEGIKHDELLIPKQFRVKTNRQLKYDYQYLRQNREYPKKLFNNLPKMIHRFVYSMYLNSNYVSPDDMTINIDQYLEDHPVQSSYLYRKSNMYKKGFMNAHAYDVLYKISYEDPDESSSIITRKYMNNKQYRSGWIKGMTTMSTYSNYKANRLYNKGKYYLTINHRKIYKFS